MECPICLGKGYNKKTITEGGELQVIKVWCEKCEGSGKIPFEGDRDNINWEGE